MLIFSGSTATARGRGGARRLPRLCVAVLGLLLLTGTGTASAASTARSAAGDDPTWAGTGTAAAGAPPLPQVRAAAWVVADLDTGAVLAAKDPHGAFSPASTLKVLTALALLPVVPPTATVVPSQADVAVEGSKVGLLPGVPYTGEQVYTGLFLVSGNDAANALASTAGGTEAAVRLMNAKAQRLGARDTRAVNPHGLDAVGQVSSAYDLAVLGRAALAVPDIARWVSTQRGSMPRAPGQPDFQIANHNRLLSRYPGAIGVKNGYTTAAQATYIGAAERGGRRLVVTLMRATPAFWPDAQALLDWGFAADAAGVAPIAHLPQQGSTAAASAAAPARARVAPPPVPAARSGPPVAPVAGALLAVVAVLAVRPRGPRRPRRGG